MRVRLVRSLEACSQLRLLDDPTWACRANLGTRMHNDVDRYVQIPNPLHGVRD